VDGRLLHPIASQGTILALQALETIDSFLPLAVYIRRTAWLLRPFELSPMMTIREVDRLDLRPVAWAALCPECLAKILVIYSHGILEVQEPHCRHLFDPQKTNGSIHVAFQRDVD
jgi:hypothetical protein